MGSKKFRSLEEVREIVERLQASGLSRWAFAKVEGICYTTLLNYEKRAARGKAGESLQSPGTLAFSQGGKSWRRQRIKKNKQSFVELVSPAGSGSGSFFLLKGSAELEFSLVDLAFVLSELDSRA